jgi:hypothetical protein
MPSTKKPTRSKLVKKLDAVFSEYIRRRYADENGLAQCVTCNKKDHWKKLQAGHFISRTHYSTRWDETNVQVQCARCNIFRSGEQYLYSLWLDANIGDGTSESLLEQSRRIDKILNYELSELITKYENILKELQD